VTGLRIAGRVMEPVQLLMTRRMLRGIRQRAERAPAAVPPASPAAAAAT
jgi:hypothetical protein